MKNAVESLTYSRGFGKNEADVFQYVTESMFTPAAGDRPNVPNIVSQAYSSTAIVNTDPRTWELEQNRKVDETVIITDQYQLSFMRIMQLRFAGAEVTVKVQMPD